MNINQCEVVDTTRLKLRRFSADDWQDLYEYLSQEETVMFEPYGVFTEESAKAEAARRADDTAFWACELNSSGKVIGNVYLAEEDCGNCEIGYVFNQKYWHNGYASEAVKAMINWAFNVNNAHRITAMCNPANVASWKLLERVGMRREGHLESNVFFNKDPDGNPIWQDTYIYAVLQGQLKKINFIEYKRLNLTDLSPDMLTHYIRRQEIKKTWRKINNEWVLIDNPFVADWDENFRKQLINEDFPQAINSGGAIACLIVDGMPVERFEENIHRIIPAYLNGLSESGFTFLPSANQILTMILIKFGYRMLQEHIFENEPWGLGALEKLYEIRSNTIE